MYKAVDIARYFVACEPEKYNEMTIERGGSRFYEGNARLNKYLQLAQNLYIARNGKQLMDDMFVAYANGAIVYDVMSQYKRLIAEKDKGACVFKATDKEFLDKFIRMFKNSSIDELIELSHEDEAWIDARRNASVGGTQAMHPNSFFRKYSSQYHDANVVMDRMEA